MGFIRGWAYYLTRMTGAKPDTMLAKDGHCATQQGTGVRECLSHDATIPLAWDCCGQCPGKHTRAVLKNGKEIDAGTFPAVAELARKLGVRFG